MAKAMRGNGAEDGSNRDAVALLTRLLLIELRATDPDAGRPNELDLRHTVSPSRWLAPAAALAAGEPKRALALLTDRQPDATGAEGSHSSSLHRALRSAAVAMDVNWQPGSSPVPLWPEAKEEQFEAAPGIDAAVVSGTDPRLRLCAHLAARVIPALLSSRLTLGHAMRAGAARERTARYGVHANWPDADLSAGIRESLTWFDSLYEEIAAAKHEEAAACHLLLAADLRVRAGDRQAAQPLLRHGLRFVSRSHATAGLAALLAGDWELGPPGTAENCTVLAAPSDPRALSRAEKRYEQADAAYLAATSQRGRAAALLRLAHVQRLRDSLDECRETVVRARELAIASGDGACAALLRIHQALDVIQVGPRPGARSDPGAEEETEAAEDVVSWAATDGSTSWLIGLRQLVLERSEFWGARGDVVRSKRAALLAQRLSEGHEGTAAAPSPWHGGTDAGTAVTQAAAPVTVPSADVYRWARHRLAGIVLTDLEHQDHLERVLRRTEQGEPPELADCLGVIQTAKILHDQASALRDPDVMAASRARINLAISAGTDLLTGVEPMDEILAVLRSDLASCPAQEAFFRSRRSRSAGLEQEADRLARQALREADRIPDETFRRVLRCAAHVDLREWADARAEMEAVEPHLSALQAAALWLRLRRPERAAPHVTFIDPGPGPGGPDHPWERPAIQADLALARGAYGQAADHARLGLDAYEAHQIKLARDALRASFADDQVVAGLYHAAVLSTLSLGGPEAAAAAFTQAERSRAGFFHAVHALDTAGTDRAAVAAVRNWLAAEVRWSAEFEEHAATLRGPASAPTPGHVPDHPGVRAPGHPALQGPGALPGKGWGQPASVPPVRAGRPAPRDPVGHGHGAETPDGRSLWNGATGKCRGGKPHEGGTPPVGPTAHARGTAQTTHEGRRPAHTRRAPQEERRRRIQENERALDAAEAAVRKLVPAALTASGSDARPDAAAVAEALPPGTLLLAYHLFDDDLVGWAMTRETLRSDRRTRWAHSTVAAARRFHDRCAAEHVGSGCEEDGRELAELLLRPFATQLRDHRRVLVVPPATLSLLPFHALPWNGDVLGATHEVSYLPSASLLTRRRHQTPDRPWAEMEALLVGDPAADPRHGLRELPGTGAETAELARLLPHRRLLTGPEATRAHVLDAAPRCQVLHFATHGIVDELAPNRSRLPLAGDDFLGLADLLSAAHGPQLLVLSACDTGLGAATAGGDVVGLTRAALITGARHAVVSLWPVDDRTGCLVVTRTYRYLVDGPAVSVGSALARAQREVRELSGPERDEEFRTLARRAGTRPGPVSRARTWRARDSEPLRRTDADDRHPYHWAPFIHVGI